MKYFVSILENLLGIAEWVDQKIGGPANFWFGHNYLFVTSDVKDVKIILNHPMCINKSRIYNDVEYFFGKSSLAFANSKYFPFKLVYIIYTYLKKLIKNSLS